MQVVQIVKKYGPFGGMEEYVYQLAKELSKLGFQVIVLCEKSSVPSSADVRIHAFGTHRKPHWISHYRFSNKVNHWLSANLNGPRVVHSHERQCLHNITTFHTTPYKLGKSRITKWLSPRNFFYEKLERRELFGTQVRAVVPVSNLLGTFIKDKYSVSDSIICPAIHPAVKLSKPDASIKLKNQNEINTIGFIGKEWERKGLPKVISIWRALRKKIPNLKLRIAGVELVSISHLFKENDSDLEILGFIEKKEPFYESIDLLIHPAKFEAFGMVVSEALFMQVPVLCSSECGASEILETSHGISLPEKCGLAQWVAEANRILEAPINVAYERNWESVAAEYSGIYAKLLN